ncbi:MAG: DegT/DnrJ/EryC1/StrS family aminotransferase [Fibrobacteria bacterium]|nr:DegT/DnrJ/EryC1/StrS family aminotransferase [Fibrobacteria bacterium]
MKVPYFPLGDLLAPDREGFHEALDRVLDSGQILLGRELEAFETSFARVAGSPHCIGVGSGLDAIALMLLAAELPADSEVLVPANSFIASALGVERAGLRAIPVEIDPATGNLDVERLEDALTPRTRAVLAVHLHGIPCDMDALGEACRRWNLRLFEDAAQAHGALWRGKPCGSFGDAAAFSFYPGKNLGALGDGGAVTTSDPGLDARVRLWRNYGSRVKYVHDLPGWNSRMEELQAAFLAVRLRHLESDNLVRRRAAELYTEALRDVPGVRLPRPPEAATPSWHLFPVLCEDRDLVQTRLEAAGITTLVHYPTPLHLQPCLETRGERSLPAAKRWCDQTLSLPIHPRITEAEVRYVSAAVAESTR